MSEDGLARKFRERQLSWTAGLREGFGNPKGYLKKCETLSVKMPGQLMFLLARTGRDAVLRGKRSTVYHGHQGTTTHSAEDGTTGGM